MEHDTRKEVSAKLLTSFQLSLRKLLSSWEIYPLFLFAAFLRLYCINTTEFDGDQADIFSMAHNAVSHGHLVATSNVASIGIFNPPATIYALMVPAAFSPDPVGGAILIALLAIAAVFLTYLFTRRYYGRPAATWAALLYATAFVPVFFARFMWNQNLLLFFVPLFFWFLFRGAVARRTLWFFPSVVLLGLLVQFHASTIELIASLLVALVLAPRSTFRWYDIVLGVVGLLFIYASYIYWLFQSHFIDINTLLHTTGKPVVIDAQAIVVYLQLFGPLPAPVSTHLSLLAPYALAFSWIRPVMALLVLGGICLAVTLVVRARRDQTAVATRRHFWVGLGRWWITLRQSPLRCGLLLLLTWQLVSLLYLSRRVFDLRLHYFIMFMPGPFILAGFFLAAMFSWLRKPSARLHAVRIGLLVVGILLVLAQCLSSFGYVYDSANGRYVDYTWAGQYYNSLISLQESLQQADTLAQQRHLNHIYISADLATQAAFFYLATQTKTPTTVVPDTCLVWPGAQNGAAVLLTAPRSHLLNLVNSYAAATPVATAPHPGGPPFHLYVLNPLSPSVGGNAHSTSELGFMDAHSFNSGQKKVQVTRWTLSRSAAAGYRTSYNYTFGDTARSALTCSLSAMRSGDQLLVPLTDAAQSPTRVQVSAFTTLPTVLTYNFMGAFPLLFDTFHQYNTPTRILQPQSSMHDTPENLVEETRRDGLTMDHLRYLEQEETT